MLALPARWGESRDLQITTTAFTVDTRDQGRMFTTCMLDHYMEHESHFRSLDMEIDDVQSHSPL